jgi:hypothetical protein
MRRAPRGALLMPLWVALPSAGSPGVPPTGLSGWPEVLLVTGGGGPSNEVASRVASCPAGWPCEVTGPLYGPHRVGVRLVMILLSHRGWTAVAIAELLGC